MAQLRNKSYVDDIGLTAENKSTLMERTKEADAILAHANMKVKKWIISGESLIQEVDMKSMEVVSHQGSDGERMLGVMWIPDEDVFKFSVRINLSPLKNKSRIGPDLTKSQLLSDPPSSLTRRQYYSQIQSFFDPIGLLAPVLLKAKLLLRKSWEGDCSKLKWDDPLPEPLVKEMIDYFAELFELEDLSFSRSLWPHDEVVGKPDLICFSDGSLLAFGTVLYIRWKLKAGGWWTSLIMSKSKIAPKNRITIPRLELNGAVLAKRLREFVTNQLDLTFENVFHLVDSSTVLGYLHKADAKLKPFEGIRVAEVQAAGKFVDGRLENWSWVDGESNPADWATKPRIVSDLAKGGFWQQGPSFLRQDYSSWPLKHDFKMGPLDGELLPKSYVVYLTADVSNDWFHELLSRVSSIQKLYGVLIIFLNPISTGRG